MKLHRWNGECWWVDDRSIPGRVVRWLAWFGGWEAHAPHPDRPTMRPWTMRERLSWRLLTPVSLFGHRITFYGWGRQLRTRNGWWVWTRRGVYWSPDGTPGGATVWLRGTPPEVVHAARKAERVQRERMANLTARGKDAA